MIQGMVRPRTEISFDIASHTTCIDARRWLSYNFLMHNPSRPRRLIALFVAYVVALQALLLPLSAAAGVTYGTFCADAASVEDGHRPVNHDTGCPCADGCGVLCCAQALTGPLPVEPTLVHTDVSVLAYVSLDETPVRLSHRRAQVARAPPRA